MGFGVVGRSVTMWPWLHGMCSDILYTLPHLHIPISIYIIYSIKFFYHSDSIVNYDIIFLGLPPVAPLKSLPAMQSLPGCLLFHPSQSHCLQSWHWLSQYDLLLAPLQFGSLHFGQVCFFLGSPLSFSVRFCFGVIIAAHLFVQARTQIRCIYNDIGQNYIPRTCSCSSSVCNCIELDVTGSDSGDVLYWHKAALSMSGERLLRSPVKSGDGASIVQWQTQATGEDKTDTSMMSNGSLAFEALSFFSFLFSFYIFIFI